jgi:predicted ArsR family transcriptional regulator
MNRAMEQLYTLKRLGKRLIFEEWNGRPTRQQKDAKSRVLDALKKVHPSGLGATELLFEIDTSRASMFRILPELVAEGLVEITHKQPGRWRPRAIYRAVK